MILLYYAWSFYWAAALKRLLNITTTSGSSVEEVLAFPSQ